MDAFLQMIADPDGYLGVSSQGWMVMAGVLVFGGFLLKCSRWYESHRTTQRRRQYEESELGRRARDEEDFERKRRREEVARQLEHFEQGKLTVHRKTRKATHASPGAPGSGEGTPGKPGLKARRKVHR